MLTDLIASARELRSPLVLGYSLLFTVWLFVRDEVSKAASVSSLARDIQKAIESLGGVGELALVTFFAAMLGSLIWNVAIERVVESLKRGFSHPDWDSWTLKAQETVKQYEEYSVTTYKAGILGEPPAFDSQHNVPSPLWARHLQAEVEGRARKASEVEFRITLAVALLPIAAALAIEGGGYWWLSWLAPAIIWFDLSILKHTTAALLIDYEIRDGERSLEQLKASLKQHRSRQPKQPEME